MNKQEVSNMIHKWLVDNELYYQIDPMDTKEINSYMKRLDSKLIELYKLLVSNNIISENNYNNFLRVFEYGFNRGRNDAFFRH